MYMKEFTRYAKDNRVQVCGRPPVIWGDRSDFARNRYALLS